ncbi:DUF6894 family protein [Sphingomonas desiccabilis]|uniref:DUF6894 domain-containing protein n=1 Tax=Sphingomonas desiccabilis TaxID=429134 RepID=A0A4Q2J050_9SPHN|nr:hypothetical protein [Sphingomonas desiccabilis]MBB3910517.1 hypothetical protein [Sphingomonas desiccabilis]RXZ35158.1 hypothetical protein EO081_05845 [Sphingomonas desiccabilis]
MRYFFHINDGKDLRDSVGVEFASTHEARLQAVQTAGALIADNAHQFWAAEEWSMVVTDADNLILFMLTFNGTMAPAAEQLIRLPQHFLPQIGIPRSGA